MPEVSAGVDGFAFAGGPSAIHHRGTAHAGTEREAVGECLAQADEVRIKLRLFAGEPFAGAAEAGIDFIANQERMMRFAQGL